MRTLVVTVVAVLALVGAPVGLADSSTVLSGYGSNASKPVVRVKGAQGTTPTQAGTLPFTGSELTWFVAGGVVLLGMGLGLRRLGRDNA